MGIREKEGIKERKERSERGKRREKLKEEDKKQYEYDLEGRVKKKNEKKNIDKTS